MQAENLDETLTLHRLKCSIAERRTCISGRSPPGSTGRGLLLGRG